MARGEGIFLKRACGTMADFHRRFYQVGNHLQIQADRERRIQLFQVLRDLCHTPRHIWVSVSGHQGQWLFSMKSSETKVPIPLARRSFAASHCCEYYPHFSDLGELSLVGLDHHICTY